MLHRRRTQRRTAERRRWAAIHAARTVRQEIRPYCSIVGGARKGARSNPPPFLREGKGRVRDEHGTERLQPVPPRTILRITMRECVAVFSPVQEKEANPVGVRTADAGAARLRPAVHG